MLMTEMSSPERRKLNFKYVFCTSRGAPSSDTFAVSGKSGKGFYHCIIDGATTSEKFVGAMHSQPGTHTHICI